MFHGFLSLGGKKCRQLFSCTGRGGELGSKAGLLVFITLKKMPKSLEKENRGRVPKIGMAGGLRMCLLLFFGFCSGVVLCSHWSRGLGEREFPSLSFVTLAHRVPSATPLSAFFPFPLPCHLPARLFRLLGEVPWVALISMLTLWYGIGS